jgi:hypothetical protein
MLIDGDQRYEKTQKDFQAFLAVYQGESYQEHLNEHFHRDNFLRKIGEDDPKRTAQFRTEIWAQIP